MDLSSDEVRRLKFIFIIVIARIPYRPYMRGTVIYIVFLCNVTNDFCTLKAKRNIRGLMCKTVIVEELGANLKARALSTTKLLAI